MEINTNLIKKIISLLPFAATVAHQQVYLYILKEGKLEILATAYYRSKTFLTKESIMDEKIFPLWYEVLRVGRVLQGTQKFLPNIDTGVSLFPVIDNGGKVIAALAFVSPKENDYDQTINHFLAETACMSVLVPQEDIDLVEQLYKPLSYQDGVLIFNDEGTILYANEMAIKLIDLLGFDRRLVGASIYGGTLKLSLIKQAVLKHQGHIEEAIYGDIVLEQLLIPVISGGRTKRNYLILKDLTFKRRQEQELLVKNSVIKEIHHRVKNNLQSVAGLLRMQARQLTSEEAKLALQEGVNRIESLALVHEIVSHYDEEYISLRSIAEELVRLLRVGMLTKDDLEFIDMEYMGEEITLTSHQASYVSLILNELVSNSLEHGVREQLNKSKFQDGSKSYIYITGKNISEQEVSLSVSDNGVGLPPKFDLNTSRRLGLQIIRNLVENELAGKFEFTPNHPQGVTFHITFKKEA